ncbi:MAG: SCO family protein [Bacteroidota bacterium]
MNLIDLHTCIPCLPSPLRQWGEGARLRSRGRGRGFFGFSCIAFCLIFISYLSFFSSCARNTDKEQSLSQLPYYSEATFTPHWLNADDPELEDFHRIPKFSLTNQLGETVTEETFAGKIYVADFFFTTCPGICMDMTKNMSLLQAAFLDYPDVLLLSHSVTPVIDSVSRLESYGRINGVDPGRWHLVTGDRGEIYSLGREAYFVEEDLGIGRSNEEFLHTENFVLIDQNRHIRGIYNGLKPADIRQLIEDMTSLLDESGF